MISTVEENAPFQNKRMRSNCIYVQEMLGEAR